MELSKSGRVSRINVDVGLNNGHWSDLKCGQDFAG